MVKIKTLRPPRTKEDLLTTDMMKCVPRDKLTEYIDESSFCFLLEAAFIQQDFHDSVKAAVKKGANVEITQVQARRMISICIALGPYTILLKEEYPSFYSVISFIENNYNKIVAHVLLEGMDIPLVKV